jgi:hypothetical protein
MSDTGWIVLAVAVVLPFVFRAVALWYWRVNDLIETLQSIDKRLAAANRANKVDEETPLVGHLPPDPDSPEGRQLAKWGPKTGG